MSSSPSCTRSCETPDPYLAESVARAERRRGMLEHMSASGIRIIDEIEGRTVQAPLHPEPRHDPARAFAQVSRSVRLTLAFEARIDRDILAIRNGTFRPDKAIGGGAPAFDLLQTRAETPAAKPARVFPVVTSAERHKVRDAVSAAIDRESGDVEIGDFARRRLHERLIEGEDYDGFLDLPFRECVAAICVDLGLRPDWSGWTEAGMPAAPEERQLEPVESG